MGELATALLPVLHRSLEAPFNVFEVMHHGTHEKQISNVFRWLLETEANHHLGDTFVRIFIEEVNRGLVGGEPFAPVAYLVLQEVNTSDAGGGEDIADLVLRNDDSVIVVENHFTSDGHGHSYDGYLRYSQRGGRQGAVVLLCHDQDSFAADEGVGERGGRHLRSVGGQVATRGREGPSVPAQVSGTVLIHRPDAPQVRQGERSCGRPSSTRLRRCDVCDGRSGEVRGAVAQLGGGEVRQRRRGAGAGTLRRRSRTVGTRQGSVEELQ